MNGCDGCVTRIDRCRDVGIDIPVMSIPNRCNSSFTVAFSCRRIDECSMCAHLINASEDK